MATQKDHHIVAQILVNTDQNLRIYERTAFRIQQHTG